jgi:hypothetical protein
MDLTPTMQPSRVSAQGELDDKADPPDGKADLNDWPVGPRRQGRRRRIAEDCG